MQCARRRLRDPDTQPCIGARRERKKRARKCAQTAAGKGGGKKVPTAAAVAVGRSFNIFGSRRNYSKYLWMLCKRAFSLCRRARLSIYFPHSNDFNLITCSILQPGRIGMSISPELYGEKKRPRNWFSSSTFSCAAAGEKSAREN